MIQDVTIIKHLLYFSTLLVLISCKSGLIETSKETEKTMLDTPKIAFLTFKISKDQNNEKSIALTDILKVEGKFKQRHDEKSRKVGDYELLQLDKNGKQLALTIVENPLNPTVEYVNEEGEFAKKNIDFKSKETSIRVQLNSKTYYILMQEIGNESKNFLKIKM